MTRRPSSHRNQIIRRRGGEASEGTEGQNQAEENAGAEQATAYARCENVKQ
jgi:hypothetical protein